MVTFLDYGVPNLDFLVSKAALKFLCFTSW